MQYASTMACFFMRSMLKKTTFTQQINTLFSIITGYKDVLDLSYDTLNINITAHSLAMLLF